MNRLKQVITDADPQAMYDLLRDIEGVVDRAKTTCQLGANVAHMFGVQLGSSGSASPTSDAVT